MIRKIEIENFKSVKKLELELGRVTVLIGANGAGKSNILEGIAFASAAAANKLDSEFLSSRGIRMPGHFALVLSAFSVDANRRDFTVIITNEDLSNIKYVFTAPDDNNFSWNHTSKSNYSKNRDGHSKIEDSIMDILRETVMSPEMKYIREIDPQKSQKWLEILTMLKNSKFQIETTERFMEFRPMRIFLIYAPENRELRTFAEEGQILPLGIRGEGLFRLLKILSQQDEGAKLAILKEKLQLIDWFEDFEFQQDAMAYERRLLIRDRHLSDDLAYFDQRSANEGFLFLLFYFCLFLSDATPPFFAIDNIDSSLNPKLCAQLVRELVKMAADNGKQAILTTHNPAVLDGLDLTDPEQKLYVVRRNMDGETIVSPVSAPTVQDGQEPVPLSEAFLRGYLGGLPTNF